MQISACVTLQHVSQGTENTAEALHERAEVVNQRCEGQIEYQCRAAKGAVSGERTVEDILRVNSEAGAGLHEYGSECT